MHNKTLTREGYTYPVIFSNVSRAVSVIFSLMPRDFCGSILPWPYFFSRASRPAYVTMSVMPYMWRGCVCEGGMKVTHPCQGNPPAAGPCWRSCWCWYLQALLRLGFFSSRWVLTDWLSEKSLDQILIPRELMKSTHRYDKVKRDWNHQAFKLSENEELHSSSIDIYILFG